MVYTGYQSVTDEAIRQKLNVPGAWNSTDSRASPW